MTLATEPARFPTVVASKQTVSQRLTTVRWTSYFSNIQRDVGEISPNPRKSKRGKEAQQQ